MARLDYYEPADLEAILVRAARILGVPLEPDGAREIAGRARGTPRIANRLLKRVRDYAEVRGDGSVNGDTARSALAVFEVDERGLDKVDRALLRALCVTFAGQPVGLSTLAVAVGEEPDTVEDVYEPFLLKQGLIMRTPRGRVATAAGFGHHGSRHRCPRAAVTGLVRPGSGPSRDDPRASPPSVPLPRIALPHGHHLPDSAARRRVLLLDRAPPAPADGDPSCAHREPSDGRRDRHRRRDLRQRRRWRHRPGSSRSPRDRRSRWPAGPSTRRHRPPEVARRRTTAQEAAGRSRPTTIRPRPGPANVADRDLE